MTDTINNVPRELLERAWRALANSATGREIGAYLDADPCAPECAETCARASMCSTCSATLSAPSPAGVDGLNRYEVFPYLDDEVAEIDICESDDGSFVKYEDAQAIIDGLRGENEALQAQVKVLQSDANSWQSGYDEGRRMGGKHCALTIDQQAQRIGELASHLEFAVTMLTVAGLAGNAQVEAMRAALSAGKDAAP